MSDHTERMISDPVYAWIELHYDELIQHSSIDEPLRELINAQLAQLRATIAQQAAQLEQAREVIRRVWILSDLETSKQDVETDSNAWQIEADTRAWLSADTAQHAQAQQA